MKAEKLMIGDWLYFNEEEFDYVPVQVESLTMGDIFVKNENNPLCYEADAKDLEYIPLTAEILEKNGFAHEHSYEEGIAIEKFCINGMRIDQLAEDLFVWICPATNNGILTFHYVHELQHALRLCKIDKEIEL